MSNRNPLDYSINKPLVPSFNPFRYLFKEDEDLRGSGKYINDYTNLSYFGINNKKKVNNII